jgi:hypothetical protein
MMPKWLQKWQAGLPGFKAPVSQGPERRGAPRHDVHFEVWLRRRGLVPAAASIFSISRTGAAIRIHGWNVPVPSPWPTRLNHGDEIWLTGLFDTPVSCWVIAVDEGVLRVHFSMDEDTRDQLREMITALPQHDFARPR